MKYLIAALPIATLVACGGSGSGGGGTGTSAPSVQYGTSTFNQTTGTTIITQNGTSYGFVATSGGPYLGAQAFILENTSGAEIGYVVDSSDVRVAFGNMFGTMAIGLDGIQTAPAQAQTGAIVTYSGLVAGTNAATSSAMGNNNLTYDTISLQVDFGAGTITNIPGNTDLYTFNGQIYNAIMVDGTISHGSSANGLVAGSGHFTGGFYGTDELAGLWQTTGANGDEMSGLFFMTQ
jgi:hypothetical protein